MMNLHEILEKARSAGQRLPYNEAAVLFAAAVRIAAAHGSTLRGALVQIDEAGLLHVGAFDEHAPEAEPGYLAPELLAADAPPKSDPSVQVYAAGALGYELLTGKLVPQPGHPPGPELSGPLGDVVRLAMAPDPRARYGDLERLHDAVEVVQPRPPPEGERNILSALRVRFSRPPPEKEALARVIEKLHHLEVQVAQLGKAHSRLEAAHQQSLEQIERFEDGQRRLAELGRRPKSSVAPAILAGVLTSVAVFAAAWALGMVKAPPFMPLKIGPLATPSPEPADPEPVRPAEKPPVPAVPDAAVAEAKPPAPVQAAQPDDARAAPAPDAAVAVADAGAADAVVAQAAANAGPAPMAAAPAQVVPEKKRAPNPRQAMQHAIALSEVRRGEAALEQGRADDALASFRAALDSEPTNAAAFRGMGMAYAVQGEDAQALQSYDKYLRLAPSAPDAAEIRKSIRELKARAKSQ